MTLEELVEFNELAFEVRRNMCAATQELFETAALHGLVWDGGHWIPEHPAKFVPEEGA